MSAGEKRITYVYLFLVFEADLTNCHTAIFLEIGPWCVYDGDIVFLVACRSEYQSAVVLDTPFLLDMLLLSCCTSPNPAYAFLSQQVADLVDVPSIELALVNWAQSSSIAAGMASHLCPSCSR
jgi:hypothetical protein